MLFFPPSVTLAQTRYDLILHHGRIIDGSGNPWFWGDVGIAAGKITAVGRLDTGAADKVIHTNGLIIAPGFIDVHTHVEQGIREHPTADNFLFEGVTTIITGNCGGSKTEVAKFFAELREGGISPNVATLIGHNSVRHAVMGAERRDPTPEEQAQMEALVEQAMLAGAVGFSTGLIYVPGTYSKTAEVLGLAKAAAKHGGVYASHIRNEGDSIFAALAEAIHIGRAANMSVEISHFKISSRKFWDRSAETIALVELARAEGLEVTVDQYPYAASSTNLGVLLPSWALADGDSAIKKRLNDPATRKQIAAEMKNYVRNRVGRNRLDYAFVARCKWDSTLEGKSIAEINKLMKRKGKLEDEIQTVLEMMANGGASMVYHSMSESDVERILQYPNAMVASDAGVVQHGSGVPHPRAYGTNARVLSRYVREKKVLRLEEAIRKMTSLPAQKFRLVDRGSIQAGMAADLVVFDENRISDRATFEKPHAYAEGVQYVIVNGAIVIDEGKHNGARPGQVLMGPAARARQQDAADLDKIQKLLDEIMAADNAGNVDRVMIQYADDAVLMPPAGGLVIGKAAIAARYQAGFEKFKMEVALLSEEIRISGDWAFNRGLTSGRLIWHNGAHPTPLHDRYLMILQRQPDKSWKIARLMWNRHDKNE